MLIDIDTKTRTVSIYTKEAQIENREYKRDEKGQFAPVDSQSSKEKPDKSLAKSVKSSKINRRRKVLELPENEFAEVQSAFMSDVTKEEREQEVLVKIYKDHYYTGILREDGTRDIVGKSKGKPRK